MWRFSELDATILAAEADARLGGRWIRDVFGQEDVLVLWTKQAGIIVKTRPPLARFSLVSSPPELPKHPWRRHLRGSQIRGVIAWPGKRVVEVRLRQRDPLGRERKLLLVAELTGKYGNLVLVEEGRVVDALRRVGPAESRFRVLMPGQAYRPPPPKVQNLLTGGPKLHQRLVPYWASLLQQLGPQGFLERALTEQEPTLYLAGDEALFPSPVRLPDPPEGAEALDFGTYSEAVEAYCRLREAREAKPKADEREDLREKLLRELEKQRQKAEKFFRWGQLIMAHLHEIDPGAREVVFEGERIPLRADLSPGENAGLYFAKYKRAKRGISKLEARLAGRREPEERTAEEDEGEKKPYFEYTSPSGFKVLVGKSAKSNQELTFRLASPEDLFLHARGVPGAHVILRTEGREPQEEDILYAAKLALWHSKAREDLRGDVSYTKVKYVKRPRGAPPGTAVLLTERVVRVSLEGEPPGAPK